jgi:hypothetical protein
LKEQQQQLIEAAAANANIAKDIGSSLQEQLKQVHIKIWVLHFFHSATGQRGGVAIPN